jgi:uncharacterized protein
VQPILHLSLAVRDLDESVAFYSGALGCDVGRAVDRFVDVWFFGMQVTLHEAPDQLLSPEQRGVRHFGVTVGRDDLQRMLERAEVYGVEFSSEPTTDYAGTPREQTKAKLLDPSGNVIEIKTYVDVVSALGEWARA